MLFPMLRRRAPLLVFALSLTQCPQPLPSASDAAQDATAEAATDASDGSSDAPGDGGSGRYVLPSCTQPATSNAPLATRCQQLVDTQGRVVVLRGVNARIDGIFDVTFSDGRAPLEALPSFALEDALRMRALGFNTLRLPLNWSGIEPTETGGINAAYLDRVAAVVDLCRQAGMYVLLDFHQDAFSKEIGEDGAPLWAIQPPPTMLLGGPLTDLGNRIMSAQVLNAFGTFFGGTDTGRRLRTRFGAMAAAVATRFATNDTVVGYELFNEPITDDDALLSFHTGVYDAIHAVDTRHLVVFEPPAARNLLDRAFVSSSPFPRMGAVYAPHVYTLSFSATEAQRRSFTYSTLRASHVAASNEARAWGTPTIVTEYGYDPNGIRAAEYLQFQGDLQDEFGESALFWLWKERSQSSWGLFDYDPATQAWTERPAVRAALARVYPQAIAGWPRSWQYDRAGTSFTLTFEGDAAVQSPSLLYVPEATNFPTRFEVRCDGAVVPGVTRDGRTGVVQVPCNGPGTHTVTLSGML